MSQRNNWVNAPDVLKPETIQAVESLGPLACEILDRWVSGWKKLVLEMEATGQILPRLQEQLEIEREVQRLTEPGAEYAWMGAMELRQLRGVSEGP